MRISCRVSYRMQYMVFMIVAWVLSVTMVHAPDLGSFEEHVTQHTLKNGWTFILVERPVAPVFSFITRVDVGSAQEGAGETGLAHMFEHMAFKGTPRIGPKNYQAEKVALVKLEEAYQAYQLENLSRQPEPEKKKKINDTFKQRQREASQSVLCRGEGPSALELPRWRRCQPRPYRGRNVRRRGALHVRFPAL